MMASFLFIIQLTYRIPHLLNPHNQKLFIKKTHVNLLLPAFCCLILFGCDKISDNVVNQEALDYQISGITAPDTVNYAARDSVVTTSIQISNPATVKSVWCRVSSLNGSNIIYSQVYLQTSTAGTGTNSGIKNFSGNFVMNQNLAEGLYQIEYYVENNVWPAPQNLMKAGSKIFNFRNIPPPVIAINKVPSSVLTDSSFVVSIKVTDVNGLKDISQVYFALYAPDGSYLNNYQMYDDGNLKVDGDLTAGDGIYSLMKSFKPGNTGTWKFEFQAKDLRNGLSNVIIQNIVVK